MPQFGGKNAKKKSSSSSTKRHFTVVIGNKEHGLYVSSSPSSAARKAVSKLCATDKKKKVQFSIREITQGSKKKTYGPYLGHIEKLKEPIELKGRVIKYKPVAKLSGKTGAKKGGMRGGVNYIGVLKIEKNQSDLNIDSLCQDYHLNRVLDNISKNTLRKSQIFKNGELKVYGYPDFIVYTCSAPGNPPVFESSANFNYGVIMLRILLTKHGGIGSSFSIYISENHEPYNIIEGQEAIKFYSMPLEEINKNNEYLLRNTSNMEKQKPISFPILGNKADKAFSSAQSRHLNS